MQAHPLHLLESILQAQKDRVTTNTQLEVVAYRRHEGQYGERLYGQKKTPEHTVSVGLMRVAHGRDVLEQKVYAASIEACHQLVARMSASVKPVSPKDIEWGIRLSMGDLFWPAADLDSLPRPETPAQLAKVYEAITGDSAGMADLRFFKTGNAAHAYFQKLLPGQELGRWMTLLEGAEDVDLKWLSFAREDNTNTVLRWSSSCHPGRRIPVAL